MQTREIIGRFSAEEIAHYCGVDQSTARRWKSGTSQPHPAALHLLAFMRSGDCAAFFGKDWKEITISRYGLHLPGWRNPIPPEKLRGSFWHQQQIEALTRQVDRLRADLEAARAAQDRAEDRAAWYRAQVVNQARFGMMFVPSESERGGPFPVHEN